MITDISVVDDAAAFCAEAAIEAGIRSELAKADGPWFPWPGDYEELDRRLERRATHDEEVAFLAAFREALAEGLAEGDD